MNEATGTERMASISGAMSSRTRRYRPASAASAEPQAVASRKPPAMRRLEWAAARQKLPCMTSSPRRRITRQGETSSMSLPMAIAASCHTSSHTATAQGLMR